MTRTVYKKLIQQLLQSAGIQLNGRNSWDIQIHNDDFYRRVIKQGSLGLGESYMDHWWDCERLDQFFERALRANLQEKIKGDFGLALKFAFLKLINLQTKKRAFEVGQKHYDLSNELFKLMLDSRMNYTCGYWKHANTLEEAQQNKLELTCRKLMLKPGMRLLDIGCGFGALAKYAAENFGVEVVGITVSKEQYHFAKQSCANLPIDIRFQDYRDLNKNEKFDRIASLGMFEHVGYLNYRTYMQIAHRCLAEDGLFLLHTIGDNVSDKTGDSWIAKYIFPNGMLPSVAQIANASEELFVMEDWHNFGVYYDKTLMAWHANFNQHWQQLEKSYDDRFYRMWNYYLLSCAGAFRARQIQLWQIVFSKRGISSGYFVER